jgi:hypothetical protein
MGIRCVPTLYSPRHGRTRRAWVVLAKLASRRRFDRTVEVGLFRCPTLQGHCERPGTHGCASLGLAAPCGCSLQGSMGIHGTGTVQREGGHRKKMRRLPAARFSAQKKEQSEAGQGWKLGSGRPGARVGSYVQEARSASACPRSNPRTDQGPGRRRVNSTLPEVRWRGCALGVPDCTWMVYRHVFSQSYASHGMEGSNAPQKSCAYSDTTFLELFLIGACFVTNTRGLTRVGGIGLA